MFSEIRFYILKQFRPFAFYLLGFFSILLDFSCSTGNHDKIPDVSHIDADIKIVRFEQELFSLDTNHLEARIKYLYQKYPEFSKLYFIQLMQFTDQMDSVNPVFLENLKAFLSDSLSLNLNHKAQILFSDNMDLIEQLSNTVKYIKYYFPEESNPVFYTLISDFAYGNFIFNETSEINGIGIGLEFFLGSMFEYKNVDPKNPIFSNYLTRCFNKDHLLKKTFAAWMEDKIVKSKDVKLLDFMIQNGIKLYLLSKIIPGIQDTVLFEYTPEQLDWCNQNKVEIWAYFLKENMLYSTAFLDFNKHVNPSPNSPGMPVQAPGQTGNFIGYQIVKSYMKNHPEKSLKDLIKPIDSQVFLKESRFKPRND